MVENRSALDAFLPFLHDIDQAELSRQIVATVKIPQRLCELARCFDKFDVERGRLLLSLRLQYVVLRDITLGVC